MSSSFNNNSVVRNIVEAETFDSRLERLYSYYDKLPTFIEKGKYMNKDPRNNVQAVLTKPEGNYFLKEWYFGHNIVTNDGDIFYAKKGAGATPAANEDFMNGRMELANPASANTTAKGSTYTNLATPITASRKVFVSSPDYPLTNDADTDNTGAGTKVVTYLTSWTTTDFNDGGTTIKNGAIHDNASPSGATKLLTHWAFTAFNKTSSDTLKVFVNHAFAGS